MGSATPTHAEGPGRRWMEELGLTLRGQVTTANNCVGCTLESLQVVRPGLGEVRRGITLANRSMMQETLAAIRSKGAGL